MMCRTTIGCLLSLIVTLMISVPANAAVATGILPVGDPAQEGIDANALTTLVTRAKETHTDALVILKNGKVVGEWYFGKVPQPIEAMSMTKSILSLAIGKLIDTGKITSLDEPVYKFYPEWWQGQKQKITIRHLLNHTSGIQAFPITEEIYRSPNFVQLALAAELSEEPGTKFRYNNKAVNLLAGIVKKASGLRLDKYLSQEIFTPLGIDRFGWDLDRAGNPHAMSGLKIKAIDLAKTGEMMINHGNWNGKHVISADWIKRSTEPAQPFNPSCGLLWWLEENGSKVTIDELTVQKWQQTGLLGDLVAKLSQLKGGTWTNDEYQSLVRETLGATDFRRWREARVSGQMPAATVITGQVIGFNANGDLGQYLIVLPKLHLVAVRQIEARNHKTNDDDFADFVTLVKSLSHQSANPSN